MRIEFHVGPGDTNNLGPGNKYKLNSNEQGPGTEILLFPGETLHSRLYENLTQTNRDRARKMLLFPRETLHSRLYTNSTQTNRDRARKCCFSLGKRCIPDYIQTQLKRTGTGHGNAAFRWGNAAFQTHRQAQKRVSSRPVAPWAAHPRAASAWAERQAWRGRGAGVARAYA